MEQEPVLSDETPASLADTSARQPLKSVEDLPDTITSGLELKQLLDIIEDDQKGLTPRQRQAIWLKYGPEQEKQPSKGVWLHSTRGIGRELGRSTTRVQQIIDSGIGKLARAATSDLLNRLELTDEEKVLLERHFIGTQKAHLHLWQRLGKNPLAIPEEETQRALNMLQTQIGGEDIKQAIDYVCANFLNRAPEDDETEKARAKTVTLTVSALRTHFGFDSKLESLQQLAANTGIGKARLMLLEAAVLHRLASGRGQAK